jgi:hypothetical protein
MFFLGEDAVVLVRNGHASGHGVTELDLKLGHGNRFLNG